MAAVANNPAGASGAAQAESRPQSSQSQLMVSRRQFIQGDFKTHATPQRPPWALAEKHFLAACSRCGACATVCPTQIITLVRGYPEVEFKRGECSFCGACVAACRDGALQRFEPPGQTAPWAVKAQFSSTCLAQRGVECRICGDHCAAAAIRFSPRLGGPPVPELNAAACTGCGACVAPCPQQAISVG